MTKRSLDIYFLRGIRELCVSNALRDQQIEEYLGKRTYSLGESKALKESQNLAEATQTFGGG